MARGAAIPNFLQSTPRYSSAAFYSLKATSIATQPWNGRSAISRRRSTGGSTGLSFSAKTAPFHQPMAGAERRSPWGGTPSAGKGATLVRMTGSATTKACWFTYWQQDPPHIPLARKLGIRPGPWISRRTGAPTTVTNISSSSLCSDTSTATSGSIFAASRMTSCVRRASTISRIAGAPR